MTRDTLLAFLRSHRHATQASVSAAGNPQAAIVGIAVSDQFEIVFDTLESTRKASNLIRDARIAFVVGDHSATARQCVQYEGIAERPVGAELAAAQALYFQYFPDGRDRLGWPGIIHLLVRPRWIRFSDYTTDPPLIVELTDRDLTEL